MAGSRGRGLFLTAPGQVALREFDVRDPRPGEARISVAGCGLCHTDVTFYSGAVRPRLALPLILGHEIAGTVKAALPPYERLVGRAVIVPAILPCDACDLCRAGRDNACGGQVMPGNHIYGGFATDIVVPARHLVPLDGDLRGHALWQLAVVADAVTTPYQALHRACARAGDLVVVIGVGGIGTFAVQIARAFGAEVAAIDVDRERLERAAALGARWAFDARETDGKAVKKLLLADGPASTARWKILEMSGTAAGQELAWALLPPAGTLGIVGFTMDLPAIRLSNLMALDATAFGSWGCSPRHYAAALDLVLSGRVQVKPFVERHALEEGPGLLAETAAGASRTRRPVLLPTTGS